MVTNDANRRKIVHFIVQNLQLATGMAWQQADYVLIHINT